MFRCEESLAIERLSARIALEAFWRPKVAIFTLSKPFRSLGLLLGLSLLFPVPGVPVPYIVVTAPPVPTVMSDTPELAKRRKLCKQSAVALINTKVISTCVRTSVLVYSKVKFGLKAFFRMLKRRSIETGMSMIDVGGRSSYNDVEMVHTAGDSRPPRR